MKFAHRIAHLIFPRQSNNQRAKILHPSGLTTLIFIYLFYQLILTFLPRFSQSVLGYAANIPPGEVIRLTNEKRIQAGLNPLTENAVLNQAAQAKGADMLNKGYWAHVSPDGTQPWKFFTDLSYRYRYAGENLARDFSGPEAAVDAWMASSSHRENLLSPKYQEIGIAVVEGNLAGVETTIIVQFFGTRYVDSIPAIPVAKAQTVANNLNTPIPAPVVKAVSESKIVISPFAGTKTLSLVLVGFLITIFVVDAIIISRRKITRVTGRTFAHLAFLGMILIIVLLLKVGLII